MAAAGRAAPVSGLGPGGGRGAGTLGAALGHHQRDQRPRRQLVGPRDVPARAVAVVRRCGLAVDNLLAAHVAGYEEIHRVRPDAVVTTNNASLGVYELDRMLTDLLLARGAGVERRDVEGWIDDRRRLHEESLPAAGPADRLLRRLAALGSPYGSGRLHRAGAGAAGASDRRPLRRAVDAVYDSPHDRTLDVLGLDYYDPWWPATSGSRATGRPGAAIRGRRGSCGTTSPTRPG